MQSNAGNLYRIDIENKEVAQINLGGETSQAVTASCSTARPCNVVRGGEGVIVPVELSEVFASGKVGEASPTRPSPARRP